MLPRHLRASVLVAFVVVPLFTTPPALEFLAAGRQARESRIVAVGDIHGAAEGLRQILQAAGIAGPDGRWTGGTATFVQTGDYLDRGADVRQVMDLLMNLEGQARTAGGRAEILLGNHEAMNLLREFRDTSPQAFTSFADARSEDRRRKAYDDVAAVARRSGGRGATVPSREEWMQAHPPGFVEYVDALGARGRYGKWLRARKVMARIDRTVFMHAGIAPPDQGSLDDVNREVAKTIADWDSATETLVRERIITPYFTLKETVDAVAAELLRIQGAIDAGQPVGDHVTQEFVQQLRAVAQIGDSPLLAANGPLWFRGLSGTPTDETTDQVTALLARLDATRIVVGHTPILSGKIVPQFEGRVFPIDTGMLASYFKGGRPSALELTPDRVTAIYGTERDVLVGR